MCLVGICAKARSGKDTFADFLVKEFLSRERSFIKIAFAGVLKDHCMDSFGLTHEQLYGDQKEMGDKRYPKVPAMEGKMKSNGWWCGSCRPLDECWTPREIMQAVGSFYRSIDYDYWVKQLDKEIKSFHREGDDFIITDVRHVNECEYVRKNKGILIKIFRDINETIHGIDHESETALDNYDDFDIYINNSGTLEELEQSAFDTANVIMSIEKYVSEGGIYYGE